MALTYEPIATTTLTSAQATVTFSSIPSTYTDLVLITFVKDNTGGVDGLRMRLNGDTGSNYSDTYLLGNGTAAQSNRNTNVTSMYNGLTADSAGSEFAINIHNFMNYSNTTTNKTAISRMNIASYGSWVEVALWRSTAAINSITITNGGGVNFAVNSSFTLYGIKAA